LSIILVNMGPSDTYKNHSAIDLDDEEALDQALHVEEKASKLKSFHMNILQ